MTLERHWCLVLIRTCMLELYLWKWHKSSGNQRTLWCLHVHMQIITIGVNHPCFGGTDPTFPTFSKPFPWPAKSHAHSFDYKSHFSHLQVDTYEQCIWNMRITTYILVICTESLFMAYQCGVLESLVAMPSFKDMKC